MSFKRLSALIIAAALIFTAFPSESIAAQKNNETITFSVSYSGNTFDSYYSDSYFSESACEYNPSLSTVSFCACIASIYDFDYAYRHLSKLGFKNISGNDYFIQDTATQDSMGVVAARKTVSVSGERYTLIIVLPRSTNYGAEWASNFTIGYSGNAQGFEEGKEQVLDFLNDYIEETASEFDSANLKVWFTGYSRGAAVANLAAAALTDDVRSDSTADEWGETLTLTQDNIYSYNFECPMAANTDVVSPGDAEKNYTNIHNVVNPNDIVSYVAPSAFGFLRYGTDENIIPDSRDDDPVRYDRAVSFLKTLSGSEAEMMLSSDGTSLYSEDFTGMTHAELNKNILDILSTGLGSRESYVDNLQPLLRIVLSENEGDPSESEKIKTFLNLLIEKIKFNLTTFLVPCSVKSCEGITGLISGWIIECAENAGLIVSDYKALLPLLKNAVPVISGVIREALLLDGGETIKTLIDNFDYITYGHYPELCIAWLQTMDPHYNDETYTAPDTVQTVYCELPIESSPKSDFN